MTFLIASPRNPASGLPQDIRWRLTSRFTARSRRKRMQSQDPWPAQITAVALEAMPTFERIFPEVRVVVADGRSLPFEANSFDIGFSNAVIEHVGSRDEQRRFIEELVRTCCTVFVATPNGGFPLDPHTLLPFVHWLPRRIRHVLLRWSGNGVWASEAALNPLRAGTLRSLFPPDCDVRIDKHRVIGMTTVLVAIARPKRAQPER
jgi:Methyltransferase domain